MLSTAGKANKNTLQKQQGIFIGKSAYGGFIKHKPRKVTPLAES
jgi:hypothetical protein